MKQFKNVLSVRLYGVAAIALAIVVSMAVMPLTGCSNPADSGGGKTLVSIEVTTPPTKTTHNIGEDLDTVDMVVTATYSDGTTAVVTGYTISGYDKNTAGEQTVTVTYKKKTATFTVTVVDPNSIVTLTGIAVTTQPTKTEYYIGETLVTAGMVVTATYSDGTTEAVTAYTTSGFDSSTAGDKTITVTYQSKTTTFKVTVIARSIVAMPTATPAGGTLIASGTTIALATATDGAEIWYTTNGSAPAKSGTGGSTKYANPFAITTLPTTVKAIAVKDDWTDSAVLTADYGSAHITVADISITAPANGATPATAVFNQPQERFTEGAVTWSPNDSVFKGSTEYTATVTLTAKQGFTFTGITVANVKIDGVVATTMTPNTTGTPGTSITVTRKFPATPDKKVSGITIKSQPTKLSYSHGDALDLAGLAVTLTYDDGTTEDVAAANFTAQNIATDPSHGNPLERATYNGQAVKITYGNLTPLNTSVLTVNPVNASALTISAIAAQTYTGTEITPTLTVKYSVSTGTSRDLVLGTDYTAAYKDNTNAGTATVTITGQGDYTGTKDVTFIINKADPVTTWPTASDITYGQALSDSEWEGGQHEAGEFEWDDDTVKPEVGTHTYKVTFTPNDTNNYETVSKDDVSITVNAAHITVADITITAPTKNATPSTTVSNLEQERFTSETVTWEPNDSPFKPSTEYTATVTLKAKQGYTFTGINEANVKVNDSSATTVTIDEDDDTSLTLTYKFPATGEKAVSSFVIKSQPTKLTYTHGDALDLAGLEVTLTYDDSTTEDVAAANFGTKGITASPSNGTPLERATYNGHPVKITIGNLTPVSTNNLTVNQGNASTFITNPASIAAQTYTGSAITPAFTLTYPVSSGTARNLTSGTDYDAAYTNNTNAGTATITITGKGEYTGTKTVTFTISAKPVSETGVTISAIAAQTYTGSEIKPTVTVSFGSTTLVSGTSYDAAYTNNTNAGTATVTITGKGNFTGTTTVNFTINKANPAITWASVTASTITYGQALSASTISGGTTVPGTFAWNNPALVPSVGNIQYGVTFTPTSTANYNNATGNVSVTVNKIDLSGYYVATIADQEYTGSAIRPQLTVKATAASTGTLSETTDYTVAYNSNTNKGTATLTITGAGNYNGTISGKTFNIVARDISGPTSGITIDPIADQGYTGSALTPEVTVKYSTTSLTKDTDYTVAYTNNTSVGQATVTISGAGNYTGTKTANFTIKKADPVITTWPTAAAVTYGAILSDSALTGNVNTTPGNFAWTTGTTIPTVSNSGYSVTFTPTDAANYNTAVKTDVAITVAKADPVITTWPSASTITYGAALSTSGLTGNVNTPLGSFAWTDGAIIPTVTNSGYSVTFTPTDAANYNTAVKTDVAITVNPKAASTLTIDAIAAVTYDSTAHTPTVTVKDGLAELALTTDYTVAYTNNTDAGQATVTITGVGNYTGTKTANFTINKADPVITTWPTAAAVTYGAILSDSALTGNVNTTPGNFAWTTGATIPTVGNSGYSVTFTPTDAANYNTAVKTDVAITVNPLTYSVTQIGGAAGSTTTTGITFTFNASIDSVAISAADITLSGKATKAATAAFTGSGTSWTLSPLTVSGSGEVTVTINKAGYESASKPVQVFAVGTAEIISVTFAQITDAAGSIDITIPNLHRVSGASSANLTLDNPAQYDPNSISWRVNGTEIGTGSSVTLKTTDLPKNSLGIHYLTISVKKNGVSYNKTIPFIVEL